MHVINIEQLSCLLSAPLKPSFDIACSQPEIKGSKEITMSDEKGQPEMQRLKSKKSYEFDDLLSMVGGFGRYTFLLYAFMCVMSLPIGLQQLVQVFYGATPKYSCVSLSSHGNNTCQAGKCCENCTDYEFSGRLTSAVTEVRIINYANNLF